MIEKKLVYVDEKMSNQMDVLHKVINDAYRLGYVADKEIFLEAIMLRESMIPTSVGFCVAIPHGRSHAVKEPFVAFMKTSDKFVWDKKNGEEVDLIFLIGVPEENKDNLHLKCLSMISKKLMQDEFRGTLRNASNVNEAYEMLYDIDKQIRKEDKT